MGILISSGNAKYLNMQGLFLKYRGVDKDGRGKEGVIGGVYR